MTLTILVAIQIARLIMSLRSLVGGPFSEVSAKTMADNTSNLLSE